MGSAGQSFAATIWAEARETEEKTHTMENGFKWTTSYIKDHLNWHHNDVKH